MKALFLFCLFCLLFIFSCTSNGSVITEDQENRTENIQANVTRSIVPGSAASMPIPPDGLGTAPFRALPSIPRSYLETLSLAFRNKDRGFLILQGEDQYESDLRPNYNEEVYLAMLFRTGPYHADAPWNYTGIRTLNPDLVRSIQYTQWEETGPMIRVTGILHLENGEEMPCEIILLWRLEEPRILGYWP